MDGDLDKDVLAAAMLDNKVYWNASNLVSGVYFYRIQAGNYVQVKKMVLIC